MILQFYVCKKASFKNINILKGQSLLEGMYDVYELMDEFYVQLSNSV